MREVARGFKSNAPRSAVTRLSRQRQNPFDQLAERVMRDQRRRRRVQRRQQALHTRRVAGRRRRLAIALEDQLVGRQHDGRVAGEDRPLAGGRLVRPGRFEITQFDVAQDDRVAVDQRPARLQLGAVEIGAVAAREIFQIVPLAEPSDAGVGPRQPRIVEVQRVTRPAADIEVLGPQLEVVRRLLAPLDAQRRGGHDAPASAAGPSRPKKVRQESP